MTASEVPPLPGGQLVDRNRRQPAVLAEAEHGGIGVSLAGPGGTGPEADVVGHGQLVVQGALVA